MGSSVDCLVVGVLTRQSELCTANMNFAVYFGFFDGSSEWKERSVSISAKELKLIMKTSFQVAES